MWLPLAHPLLPSALTGNRTSDPLVSQVGTQSTEPHKLGLSVLFYSPKSICHGIAKRILNINDHVCFPACPTGGSKN